MRFRLSFLSLVLLASTSVFAQFGIGLRGGALFSNSTGSVVANGETTDLNLESITGYVIGLPIELRVASTFAIQPEINFLQRGYVSTFSEGGFSVTSEQRYNSLEIPLLAKFGFVSSGLSVAIVVGPSFQYAVNGSIESSRIDVGGVSIRTESNTIDWDDPTFEDFKRGTVFGLAGLQAGLPLGYGKVIFDARYRFGISDEDNSDAVEIRSNGISATLGYLFTFGD